MKSPFLNSVKDAIRKKYYSIKTEQTYLVWIVGFIRFHKMKHPKNMGEVQIRQYLDYLAKERNVAPATQKVALNALVFMYRHVIGTEPGDFSQYHRATGPKKLPVVLSRIEMQDVLKHLNGSAFMCGGFMYGSGLRVMETARLRVSDIDTARLTIRVRQGKGGKSRFVTLAPDLLPHIKLHLKSVEILFQQDKIRDWAGVYLPHALAVKYPNAPFELGWQYFFPATQHSIDPRSGKNADTIFQNNQYSVLLNRLCGKPESSNRPPVTHLGTVSQRTYWKTALIFALFKNSLATATFAQQKYIHTC